MDLVRKNACLTTVWMARPGRSLDVVTRYCSGLLISGGFCMAIGAFPRGLRSVSAPSSLDGEGRVFLVEQLLSRRLAFAGRRSREGRDADSALERELREEGNIALSEPPVLHAIYFNRRVHGATCRPYIVRAFRQIAPPQPNSEIVAHGFFSTQELPEDTARATRERIAEVLTGRAASELW